MTIEAVMTQMTAIEEKLAAFQEKAATEIKTAGAASVETKNAMEALGVQQKEIAERLLAIEQKGGGGGGSQVAPTMGRQFTEAQAYKNFVDGSAQKARFEVQNNTVTGSDATVSPDRQPGVVAGAFEPLTLETLLPSMPTTSNAIEYTRETTFTNAAAETAEGLAKPEATINFGLQTMPVSTVAHWVKISRQLASDAPALAAYINTRMAFGVNKRVEMQLGAGDGVAPNLSGILNTGNFTAHGFADADLGSTLKKLVLVRKIIANLWAAGYPADAILLNPEDWAQIEIDLLTTAAGQARVNTTVNGQAGLFGVPVIQSIGVAADQFAVGAFAQACTVYNREGVVIDLSESDSDNFTKNLVTVRAERRVALTVDRPAAIIGGDLTPL